MRKIFLHGELGSSLGKEWDLEVDSVQEALWAIEANTSSLTDFFRKNSEKFGHYTFMIDGKDLDKHQLKSPIGDNEKSIHIMPQVAGGELGTIITAIVVSIVTGLIMQALFKPPKQKDAVETNSYMFGGTQNVAGQGIPVPLGYGRLRVGSVVISAATRHFNYKKGVELPKNAGLVRLGGYNHETKSGPGDPGTLAIILTQPGSLNLGTLNESDFETDEDGNRYVPDHLLLPVSNNFWDDDFGGEGADDGRGPCWIAREVYGVNNPSWLLFRFWLLNYSPHWFCNWYIQNGKNTAKWLSKNTWLKPVIRRWMDARIKFLGKALKDKLK